MIASRLAPRSVVTVALQQIALAAIAFVLLIGWLHIPDANALEVAGSILVAVLLAAIVFAGESVIALRLTNRPLHKGSIARGAIAFVVAAMLWYIVSLGIDHLAASDGLRAGYLNSRLSAGLRTIATYSRLITWFDWLWIVLRWLVAGVLCAAAFAVATCSAPASGAVTILRSPRYWISIALAALIANVVTTHLLNWTPGHGLAVESVSLAIRLLLVILLNALALGFLVTCMAAAMALAQSDGTDAPEITQPRTAEIP